MKRFLGLSFAVVGGVVVVWAGANALTGRTNEPLAITPDFRVTALTAGLAGLAACVVGLIWTRG
jgi:hypothetical protein